MPSTALGASMALDGIASPPAFSDALSLPLISPAQKPGLFLRTNARLRPPRVHRRTISCTSGSALLRDNYMTHRWVTRLGTNARGLGLPIHSILQASAHPETALTKISRAGKDAKPVRLFALPGSQVRSSVTIRAECFLSMTATERLA